MATDERLISSGELEKLSMKELVELYNSTKPKQHVKSFRSTPEAVQAVLNRLVAVSRKKSWQIRPGTQGRPPKPIDFPRRKGENCKHFKRRRKSSCREVIVRMLTRPTGATMDQLILALDRTRKQTLEGIRQMNIDLNYGFKEREDGTIELIRRDKK